MGKIHVELLKDVNGQLVPIDGVNNDILTSCIKAGDISIDGDKLYGSDNFIIDAKRLNLTINKLKHNSDFNNALELELLNEDNLVTDSVETTTGGISSTYPNFVHTIIRASDLHDALSDEVMWGNNYSDTENQTWSPANVNSGKLIIKSKLMVETLYASKYLQSKQRWIYGVAESNLYGSMNNYRTVKIGDYYFDMFDNTFIDFIARGLEIWSGAPIASGQYGTVFKSYLNSIYTGLGDGCENYINSYPSSPTSYATFNNLFVYDYMGYSVHNRGYLRSILWSIMMEYIMTLGFTVIHEDGFSYPLNSVTGGLSLPSAVFMSAIAQYSWYTDIKNEYANTGDKLSLSHSDDTSYVIGYNCIDLIMANFDTELNGSIGNNVTIKNIYNRVFESVKYSPIKFVSVYKNMQVKIGKCQTRSNKTETDSGIEIVSDESLFDLTKLFVPCKRIYEYKSSNYYSDVSQFNGYEYKFILDDLNVEKLFGDMTIESILVTSGFSSLDWMYFDNIQCSEQPIGVNNNIYYDNIPVFDEIDGDDADNYGLYIYSDFFEKYYTRQKSNLMNLYVKVYLSDNLIYFGIIDYTTISSGKKSISFEATDAIGVLIENIRKLNNLVDFAQFNYGDQYTAHKWSGSTVGSLISELIRTGYVYKTKLVNPLFSFGTEAGLENKLLENISVEDALILSLQCSKKILSLNSSGLIELIDMNDIGSTTKTLTDIISRQYNTEIYRELFSIDKLKKIAGYSTFAPTIASFFNSFRKLYGKNIEVRCYGVQPNINLLDKISLNDKVYFVASRSFDIFNNESSFTLIEIGE